MSRFQPSLITPLPESFQLPSLVCSNGEVEMRGAGSLPIVRFPNGKICYFANMFALELYSQGHATLNNGGTVRTYLFLIIHIIKYAYNNGIGLTQFTNNRFQHFMLTLNTVNPDGSKQRSQNQKIAIIFMCLDFLEFIGHHTGYNNYVGKHGTIRAEKIVSNGHNGEQRSYNARWNLENLPLPSDPGHGVAMGADALKLLKQATSDESSTFLSERNFLIIEIIEACGPRRGEAALIKKQDILDALNNIKSPNTILLRTLKHGQVEYREVPVPRSTLEIAHEHIMFARSKKIGETIGKKNDHGYLFICSRKGTHLTTNYLTNIFSNLRKKSGVVEKAHAHQLRHLFAQNKSTDYSLLLDSGIDTSSCSPNRRNLMHRLKLMQVLGHRDTRSPGHYIQQAEDALSALSLKDKLVIREEALRKYSEQLEQLRKSNSLMTPKQYHSFAKRMLEAMLDDLTPNL